MKHVRNFHKLTIPIAILALLCTLLSFMGIYAEYDTLHATHTLRKNFRALEDADGVIHALQSERGMTSGYLSAKKENFGDELSKLRKKTDKEIRLFLSHVDRERNIFDEQVRVLRHELGSLDRIRKAVDRHRIEREEAVAYYTRIITTLRKMYDRILTLSREPHLTQDLIALNALIGAKEESGRLRAEGMALLTCDRGTIPDDPHCSDIYRTFVATAAKTEVYRNYFKRFAKYTSITSTDARDDDRAIKKYERYKKSLLSVSDKDRSLPSASEWFAVASEKVDGLQLLVSETIATISGEITRVYRAQIYGFVAYFLFALAALLAFIYTIVRIFHMLKIEKELRYLVDKYVIISTTDLRGVITDASEAFAAISGYSTEELIGKPHNVVRHPDMPKETFKEMWRTLKANRVWKGEIKNRRKDGSFYWVDAVVGPMYDQFGRKIGYYGVRQDITDKKRFETLNSTLEERIEEEIEKNKHQQTMMLHQSRLAQMGEMISMIAHQWRQPLMTISTVTALTEAKMKKGKLSEEEFANYLHRIKIHTDYLSDTIEDFRSFFKPDKAKQQTTYEEIVTEALRIVETALNNRGISTEATFSNLTTLYTYTNEIKQVVLNLIKNAEDALRENGVSHPYIRIEAEENRLRIRDNAGGVPEAYLEKIFDPYFSTKEDKDGTGLGLYMSKIIIEDHCGGKLSVANDKHGAVFTIELPPSEAQV